MRATTLLLCLLALGGCNREPFLQDGTWHAEGLNDRNLRAMVADPAHLQRGIGTDTARGNTATTAVQSLEQGKVRELLDPRGNGAGVAR
jgi:hypothetical protein